MVTFTLPCDKAFQPNSARNRCLGFWIVKLHPNLVLHKTRSIPVAAAVCLAVLLGAAGLVIDLGGLFVAKTELQSALDSCALAAAQELNGEAGALTHARSAGLTAGNANNVGYQKKGWELIKAGENTFSETLGGAPGASDKNARYATCTHTSDGIANHLIQLVKGPASSTVSAVAVATRAPTQAQCAIPVGLVTSNCSGIVGSDWGFTRGKWYLVRYDNSKVSPGEMGWFDLDGSTSASETKKVSVR